MRNLLFYPFLLLKKIRTYYHSKFEQKMENTEHCETDYFANYLWLKIQEHFIFNAGKIYYDTKIKYNGKPSSLAQSRILLSILYLNNKNKIPFNADFLVNLFTKHILGSKEKNQLYKFNQKWWKDQDEGIATVWTLIALLEVYGKYKDENLLKSIIASTEAMHSHLFTDKTGLIHTSNDDFWCLNAVSTYAMFISKLLEFYHDEGFVKKLSTSVSICIENINQEGYFPYSQIRTGTYLLLYNPIVIITLEEALASTFIGNDLKDKAIVKLNLAKKYLQNQQDVDGYFVEPEQKQFSRYIISNITSLVALRNSLTLDEELKIFNNIKKYLIDDEFYLCRNEKGEFFNGNLYEVKDVLLTEVFYWLTYYLYKNK